MGDEFFDVVPAALLEKTAHLKVIATDLARLKWLQHFLVQGYDRVLWCDADFLVFNPAMFQLPNLPYALGREVWVQQKADSGALKAYKKVHNAFLMFQQGNAFLDFYADSAERLLAETTGPMPPQFIGPKLLTAIHNVVQCPVLENAGMLSPLVIRDLVAGGGRALDLFRQKSPERLAAANLCTSMTAAGELSDDEVTAVIEVLVTNRAC
ncbi:hypothetical protein QP938_00050 [Porticoccaceae bacterium LTM1]|nr:hypothetical protein QP938_00050 [Porticoccaceae bacterium LTM1]